MNSVTDRQTDRQTDDAIVDHPLYMFNELDRDSD